MPADFRFCGSISFDGFDHWVYFITEPAVSSSDSKSSTQCAAVKTKLPEIIDPAQWLPSVGYPSAKVIIIWKCYISNEVN